MAWKRAGGLGVGPNSASTAAVDDVNMTGEEVLEQGRGSADRAASPSNLAHDDAARSPVRSGQLCCDDVVMRTD